MKEIYQRDESMFIWEFMRVQSEKDDQTITRAENRRSNPPIFIHLIYLQKSIQCCINAKSFIITKLNKKKSSDFSSSKANNDFHYDFFKLMSFL